MSSIILLLLVTTLCGNCLSKSTNKIESNIDHAPYDHTRFDCSHSNEIVKSKTKFTDLNFDLLFLIFTELNFKDIRNFARMNSVFAPLAKAVIQRKCRSFEMKVIIKGSHDLVIENIDKNCISYNKMTMEETFRLYGNLIKSISMRSVGIPSTNLAVINGLIQRYCSESLVYLDLDMIKYDTFQEFKVPFDNVRSLSFEIHNTKFPTGILSLNQMFPKLSSLNIMIRCIMNDYDFLDHEFPHLQHLSIYASGPRYARVWDTRIESIITKNPQIKSVNLRGFPPGYVQMINRHLSSLEELSLHALNIGNDNIRFDHVKRLILNDNPSVSLNRLTLPCLESLDIVYSPGSFNTWKAFLQRHNNLNHLSLLVLHEQIIPLTKLTQGLSNLTDVKLRSKYHINVDTIHQFIESNRKLMRFEFTILYYFKGDDLSKLRQRYENQWHIRHIDGIWPSLLFERKITI